MKELEEDINNENCSNELNELYNLSQNEKENDIEENNLEKKININNFSTEQPPPVTRKKE